MNEYYIEEPKKGRHSLIKLASGLILVAALVSVVYYFTKVNRSATSESVPVNFTVTKGQTMREIAEELDKEKVINNKTIFIIYSTVHGVGSKIQAGEYLLDSKMTIAEIVDVLTAGRVAESGRNITIVEGMNNTQLAKYLTTRGVVKSTAEFDKVVGDHNFGFKFETEAKSFADLSYGNDYEGFLFPDTYKVSEENSANDLISKMLNNFESKISDKMLADIKSQKRGLSEIMIMASIIEKEVGRNKETITDADTATMNQERKLVASVFYNRLEIGMALESDATVNYITGKSDRSVSIDDTKINSPYNTYRVRGLPPTPISNPGLESILAAIYPADSDYVYFLNAPDGTAYFAKTLEEHGANRAKYLR